MGTFPSPATVTPEKNADGLLHRRKCYSFGCELCPFVRSFTISKVPSIIAIPNQAVNTTSLVLFMLIRSQCRRFTSVSVFGIWYCLALPTAEFSLPHHSLTANSAYCFPRKAFAHFSQSSAATPAHCMHTVSLPSASEAERCDCTLATLTLLCYHIRPSY